MENTAGLSKTGFMKSYVVPVLIIFLIPGFGLWFFKHVESFHDREIRRSILVQIDQSTEGSAEEKAEKVKFFEQVPVSRILASNNPEARELQEGFNSVRLQYGVFRWMNRIALACLVTGAGAFVAVGVGVLCSLRSPRAQYWSLLAGWLILRWFAVLQVLGQGALVVALSFWVTAFWFEFYSIKLIVIAAILALIAAGLIVVAIFRKLEQVETGLEGRILKRDEARPLWDRVAEMAAKLGIAPPDQIFVGIDDNFFVTEHPLQVGGERYSGRTLFMSLSLLKVMTRAEADAVLAHELAHFSGEDTLYSKRISPLLGKYAHYLQALYQGNISLPVFFFMFFFWNLYQLSLNKVRREREFRADRIGAELSSPGAMSRALVKVAAYCRYRQKVQEELFCQEDNAVTVNVAARIEAGFPNFMRACVAGAELAASGTPHPFDTHPPLARRLENLGFEPEAALRSEEQLAQVTDSWLAAIESASVIENEQWQTFEAAFQQAHQQTLACRYQPAGDAEIAHVVKFFPLLEFQGKKGVLAVLDYEKLSLSDWDAPIRFAAITDCALNEDTFGDKHLIINYLHEGDDGRPRKFLPADFKREGVELLDAFQKYYGRYLAAKQYLEQKKGGEPPTASAG